MRKVGVLGRLFERPDAGEQRRRGASVEAGSGAGETRTPPPRAPGCVPVARVGCRVCVVSRNSFGFACKKESGSVASPHYRGARGVHPPLHGEVAACLRRGERLALRRREGRADVLLEVDLRVPQVADEDDAVGVAAVPHLPRGGGRPLAAAC